MKIYIINNNNFNDLKDELQKMRENSDSTKIIADFLISKINSKENIVYDGIYSNDNKFDDIKFNYNKNTSIKELENEEKLNENIKVNNCINLGLFDLLEKKKLKQERYFNQEMEPEEYEELLKDNEGDIELWIKYAVSVLPPEINKDNIGKLNNKLDKALNILSRALDQNHDSSTIWNLYMDLYIQREDTESIREMFEQLIYIIPKEPWCWWLFLNWEILYNNKLLILEKMLKCFIDINGKI